jgi:hypothetical protein
MMDEGAQAHIDTLAAQVRALTAERDQWKFRASVRSDLAPTYLEERDAARADLAAANARCAELEAERSNPKHGVALDNGPRGGIVCLCGEVCNPQMGRSPARIMGSKSDTYVAVNAGTVFAQHLREANANLAEVAALQATLDRVIALPDEWEAAEVGVPSPDTALSGNECAADLRAALTPEGKP